ncbi:MAG: SHOCT domain-containing protein [Gracilimonas sp.]|uniref:SHOCT domain-containing protein n=1 Tax=Gracilimonas TaxID=649462 RepID=UPI0003A8931B|nr:MULTISPECIES: SHOCT domain-containing protein [Gracilimonas]MBO6585597.1 SHOCT domain-containing protein [Gracilimonas sp.]MBO6616594.1 SHOCT domain-containing protein [Gracilimonas sp.]
MMDWSTFCGGGMLMMIAWLTLIVLGIVALVKWISGTKGEDSKPDSALEILRKRYASGEITKEEFEERKQNLNQ